MSAGNTVVSAVKRLVQKTANRAGYEIFPFPRVTDSFYEIVVPRASYSPWNRDQAFLDTYRAVKDNTGVDIYRCHELWQLVEQSAKLDGGSLIEIGVWRGGSGALTARKAAMCGLRESVYLCDTFVGVVKAADKDSLYEGGEHSDTSRDIVEQLIKKLGLTNIKILEGIFPDQTGRAVKDEKFRFCHIDVDVYDSAKDILEWIWDKLVVGGIMVYDDYGFKGCDGIAKCVDEQRSMPDRLVIHNLNGHGIVIKTR